MYRKLAFNLAKYIYNKENTTHELRAGYYYVLLLLISSIGEITLILLLSLLFLCFKYAFMVLIVFISLRFKFNTYHCRKMETCTIFSTIIILGTSLIVKFISIYFGLNYIIVTVFITYLLIIIINNNKVQLELNKLEVKLNERNRYF